MKEMRQKIKIKRVFNIYGFTGGSYGGNVYDARGLCPSLSTCGGGNREPMIIVAYERTGKNSGKN